MRTTLKLHRALTAILITGISILVLAPAHAADAATHANAFPEKNDGKTPYTLTMYQPGPEILNGSWTFPSHQEVL